jgi:hypothetical protein
MVTPKWDSATAEEWTTTEATISVNVVIAQPLDSGQILANRVIRQGSMRGDGPHCEFDVMFRPFVA